MTLKEAGGAGSSLAPRGRFIDQSLCMELRGKLGLQEVQGVDREGLEGRAFEDQGKESGLI